MEPFQSNGKLVAGVSFDIPGMGYKNPKTGAIEGFEPDLARAIGEKLLGSSGRIDFSQVRDADRIAALQNDLVDMVLSQLTITPDREEQVDFSIPYYVTHEAILVLKGSPITCFDDLKGRRIAVVDGSVSMRRMRAVVPDAKLVVVPLSAECLEAVAKGEADAASNDMINLMLMRSAADHPELCDIVDVGDRFGKKPFGVAVKKGRRALVDGLNEVIESLKAHGDIGRLLNENIPSAGASA
jgi:polar amino acid transport system substrate-binding protein